MNNGSTKNILINILTRTSNRPNGFRNCYHSIVNQSYKNVRHIVSYDSDNDLSYLNLYNVDKIRVYREIVELENNTNEFRFAPYNLYCNELLNEVEDGWILFLDDDINLLHSKVLEELAAEISKADENTMFIWQLRYPNGKVLPLKSHFQAQEIEKNKIDTSCFLFHSKFKNNAKWDSWKASDFRFIKKLSELIPKKKWIKKVYIQNNNYEDLGNRNDLKNLISNKRIFHKNLFWFFLPKYHFKIWDIYIFQSRTYDNFFIKIIKRIKHLIPLIKK